MSCARTPAAAARIAAAASAGSSSRSPTRPAISSSTSWLVTEGAADGILTAELVAELLADYVLVNAALEEWGPGTTAARWLGTELRCNGDLDTDAEECWIEEQAAAGGRAAILAAVGTALADLEKTLPAVRNHRGELATWSPRHIRHVRRLVTYADHQLTDIERRVIEHSDAARAASTEAEQAEQGQAEEVTA
jgi:hypothetical protein